MKNTLYNIGKWVLTLLVAWGWLCALAVALAAVAVLNEEALINSDMGQYFKILEYIALTMAIPISWTEPSGSSSDGWHIMITGGAIVMAATKVITMFIIYSVIYWVLCLFSPKYQRKPILKPYFICQGLAFTLAYLIMPISMAYNYILSLLT